MAFLLQSGKDSGYAKPCEYFTFYLGLHSVKSGFVPDERLLSCKACSVIFLNDKMESHYGSLFSSNSHPSRSITRMPW